MQYFLSKLACGKLCAIAASTMITASAMSARTASAQIREQPIAFDSTGRVDVITPPLAARLSLAPPVWPVAGDYVDVRLYALSGVPQSFVLVVRRPQGIVERFTLDANSRAQLAAAVGRGSALAPLRAGPDSAPMMVSEPVRGLYVVNQTALGAFLYGPLAAAITEDAAAGTAAYLLLAGGTFFFANNLTKNTPVSRAQNHLSWHSAWRGAVASNLILFALAGENSDGKPAAGAALVGGVAGNLAGFILGKPMTDAEAHGTSYGSSVTTVLTTGVLGTAGMLNDEGSARAGTAVIAGAMALGYPLGLRYVRRAPYEVTAGDIGALVPATLLGAAAAGIGVIDSKMSEEAAFGLMTAGYAVGLVAGERYFARKFDHTVAESRLLFLGTLAGGLIGVALPVAFQTEEGRAIVGAATVGGFLGMLLTENQITPKRATGRQVANALRPTAGMEQRRPRIELNFSPTGLLFAGMGQRGNHSILSAAF